MSRSRKNRHLKHGTIYHWVVFRSNKKDKRIANRCMRHANKLRIRTDRDPYNKLKEKYDIWNFASDGPARYHSFYESYGSRMIWTDEDKQKINRK